MRKIKFCFFLCVCFLLVACSSSYYMRKGNRIYDSGRFYKAATKYEKAFNKAKTPEGKSVAAIRTGSCFQDINKLTDAYNWYRRASQSDKESPVAYLKMAEVSTQRGEFEKAEEAYQHFCELFPEDERGKDGLYRLEIQKEEMNKNGRYRVELQKELNSRQNDFSPVLDPTDNNVVYFTSTRKRNQKKRARQNPITGEEYCHIYRTEYTQEVKMKDKRGNVRIKHYPEPRWLRPVVTSDSLLSVRDDGCACFTSDGGTLYFTSSRMVGNGNVGTRIYKVTRSAGGEEQKESWTKLSKSGICGDTISIGHPAITSDGTRMYFSTDQLPGGKGGKDIWYVEQDGGGWGVPQNAGDLINTEGDEMYPYVRDNGEFYFASDGHDGLGGLDLYRVKDMDGESVLEHLPVPLNSFGDDFGICFRNEKEEGMFSSSRSNRSDNIYTFSFIPQQLRVKLLAINQVTEFPVVGASISVVGDDGSQSLLETDSLGEVYMAVEPDRDYAFVAEHPRFLKGKGELSTYQEKDDRLFELRIEMQPIEIPIVIPNIYFDVAKWELRPDAIRNLQELLAILKDNPNITIELSAHTDMVGNDDANMLLSDRRANSVVDYLISQGVYWDRLTAKGYGETQPRQIQEKEARLYAFLKQGDVLSENFVRRLSGEEKEIAMQLNRRIEFKVLRTDYKPGPNSLHNPNQKARSAEEVAKIGETRLKDIKSVEGKFFTLQLGVFKTVPAVIYNFRVVFTEKVDGEAVRYCAGIYETREEAVRAAAELKKKGIECFIREYK